MFIQASKKHCVVGGCAEAADYRIIHITPEGDVRTDVCAKHRDDHASAQTRRGSKNWLSIDEWLAQAGLVKHIPEVKKEA